MHYPRADIEAVLEAVQPLLEPHCETLTAAGSYRRGKRESRDLDLVAVPAAVQRQDDMFGGSSPDGGSPLGDRLMALRTQGQITFLPPARSTDQKPGKLGDRMARFWLRGSLVPIDLYIVLPPAVYAIILAIRTGSAEWNAAMMAWLKTTPWCIRDGALHRDGQRCVGQPRDERELYQLVGLRHVIPAQREAMQDFSRSRP